MEKRTIAQAAIEVLKEAKQPMTAAEITQFVCDNGLYTFTSKDQRGVVRRAIDGRCEGCLRKDIVSPTYFRKTMEGKYYLSELEHSKQAIEIVQEI